MNATARIARDRLEWCVVHDALATGGNVWPQYRQLHGGVFVSRVTHAINVAGRIRRLHLLPRR